MSRHHIWDPFIRLFHWSVVGLFAANALFTDAESALHEWIGYAIAALLALRLGWGLIGTRYARFSSFMPSTNGIGEQIRDMATGRRRAHLGHTPLGALMIFNILFTLIGLCATGYMMTTNAFWGVDWVEEVHEILVTWAEISVVLHIVAVLWESHRTGVNLPRAMMTGSKVVPDTVTIVE